MAEPSWPAEVELADFLSDLENVQLKVRVPPPIVVLAADLMGRVPRRVGVRSPGELVAALLVRAQTEPPTALGEALGDYRETHVHAVLDTAETEGPLALPPRADLGL